MRTFQPFSRLASTDVNGRLRSFGMPGVPLCNTTRAVIRDVYSGRLLAAAANISERSNGFALV
jgi:hypothetical protein